MVPVINEAWGTTDTLLRELASPVASSASQESSCNTTPVVFGEVFFADF